MKSVLEKDFGLSKSVFGFRVLLGNPKSEIQNRNPDFPIERTLHHTSGVPQNVDVVPEGSIPSLQSPKSVKTTWPWEKV